MGLLLVGGLPSVASAVQQDAEYYVQEKRFGDQWVTEDKQVREKLAALEEKFGKKPNIVYILADDIGYTELGAYGGGIRGFKTPNLDRLADEGMRFLSYYSQPACTFTRLSLMTGRIPTRTGLSCCSFSRNQGSWTYQLRSDHRRAPLGSGLRHRNVWQVAHGWLIGRPGIYTHQ